MWHICCPVLLVQLIAARFSKASFLVVVQGRAQGVEENGAFLFQRGKWEQQLEGNRQKHLWMSPPRFSSPLPLSSPQFVLSLLSKFTREQVALPSPSIHVKRRCEGVGCGHMRWGGVESKQRLCSHPSLLLLGNFFCIWQTWVTADVPSEQRWKVEGGKRVRGRNGDLGPHVQRFAWISYCNMRTPNPKCPPTHIKIPMFKTVRTQES